MTDAFAYTAFPLTVLLMFRFFKPNLQMYKKCFTISDEDYEYSVCPFDNVTQIAKTVGDESEVR